MPTPVTDPALLAELNGGGKAVTDPALLAQLEGKSPSLSSAITDIPNEISRSFGEAVEGVKQGLLPKSLGGGRDIGNEGTLAGIGKAGSGLLSAASIPFTPITGAVRSLIGHPMAAAERAVGGMINPEAAAKRSPEAAYEDWRSGVDTAMMGIAPRGASPIGMRPAPAPPTPSGAALRADAVDTFTDPAIKSIPIPAQDAAALSARIENDLVQRGFRPTAGSAPGTLTEVQSMTPPAGIQSVNVDDLRAARRALNMRAKERDAIGQPTPDAAAARIAIPQIDNLLDTVSPALREANANYSAGKLDQTLDYRNMKAEHRAAKTGSGSNIENTMRQEVDKIPDIGLRPDEIAARDQIVEGTAVRNALRKIGKLGFGDGVSMMYHAGLALPTGGANLPVGVAATMARKIGEALTRREIRALSNQIRSRAPVSQALANAPRNPQSVSAQTRAIAAALLAQPGQTNFFLPRSIMPAHAQDNQ